MERVSGRLYSLVEIDVDMFIILYYRSNGHICESSRNPALRFAVHRTMTSHIHLTFFMIP